MLNNSTPNKNKFFNNNFFVLRGLYFSLMLMSDFFPQLVVGQAVSMVHALSKKDASRYALGSSGPLMVSLVKVMETSGDVETVRGIAGTLHGLSSTR